MSNEQEIQKIIDDLENYFSRNMGQKSLYLKHSVATIQRRGTEFIVYLFANKNALECLDIKLATSFEKFADKEALDAYLRENLY